MSAIPVVVTLDEAANRLLTSPDKLKKEINAKRLRAFTIGEDDWRITETALLEFMGERQEQQKPIKLKKQGTGKSIVSGNLALTDIEEVLWQESDAFGFQWPDKLEQMDSSYTADIKINGECKAFTIGFTNRSAAGMLRRRAVVFLGALPRTLKPVVEFVGSNDFDTTGRMASPIKIAGISSGWRVLHIDDQLPRDYSGMDVSEYRDIVSGPNATKAAAVVVNKDNLTAMALHAIIRARWKGWL